MSADERHVVSQGQKLILDRSNKLLMIAARNVGSAYRSSKHHVAHDGETLHGIEKGDASW